MFISAWIVAGLLPAALAAPAAVPTGYAAGPPGASGSLRGNESLLGASGEPVNPADVDRRR